ncbi:MAG TPA: universal stress protein [Myxococcaceae bacterium]|nr:universal stress protein [Myxococcaceae bacterium]
MPDRRILVAADGSEQGAGRDLARRAERLRTGGLEDDTLKVAEVFEPDGVVTGSTGKQSLGRAVPGSVATRLLHVLRRPLVVVP